MWLPNDDAAALAITQLFLSLGANPGIRDDKGQSAADIAERRGMEDVASALRAAL